MIVIKPGIYQHFKGGKYQVLCMARHSETEQDMVVYKPLYGEQGIWVRPANMWIEQVEHNGQTLPRFAFLEECANEDIH